MVSEPASSPISSTRRRRGGGRSRSAVRNEKFGQPDWKLVRNTYPLVAPLSDDEIESIHRASLGILREIGIEILLPEARRQFKDAGAVLKQENDRLWFDTDWIEEAITSAPGRFTLHARNPNRNIEIGDDYIAFCAVASAPNASDLDHGRRAGNTEDYRNFLKLGQSLNIVHLFGGYPVEPIDRPVATRHLDCLKDFVTLTDRVYHVYSLGRQRNIDALEICRIGRGVSGDQLLKEPSLMTIINANSPLRYDAPMLEGIMTMAEHNQLVVVTPFTLAGAMAPVTLAGALAQQNAEALVGVALTQLVRPGAPVIYGGFTSNVDMKSGAPAFGTPEYMKAAQIGGQLARRYGIPYRSSNVNAANSVDAQAAYESVFSLWAAISGGTHLLKHGAGWLEGGLCASFEKMVLDADLLQMISAYLEPLHVDEDSLGLDAISDVGPGGHFFGTSHTQQRYQTAFYAPILSDWRNFETWRDAGQPTTAEHANTAYKRLLREYEPPPIDEGIAEELNDFVERRRREGGVVGD